MKAGYQFSIGSTIGTPISGYIAVGTPVILGQTGRRGFCSDQAARVTVDPNGGSSCSEPLQ